MRRKPQPLGWKLEVGDVLFIFMGTAPFRKIAKDTGTWTNHVGIVADISGAEPIIAESKFPFSTLTPLSRFMSQSISGKVEVKRLMKPLTENERIKLNTAAHKRLRIFYDVHFNLYSKRQFCSRFVYEVLHETTGLEIGEVQTLTELFAENPNATLLFWRLWFFGRIPWQQKTVTPASQLRSPHLATVITGDGGNYSITDLPRQPTAITTNHN